MRAVVKTCKCGRAFTQAQWEELRYVGVMAESLELRDCPCGSTISILYSGARCNGARVDCETCRGTGQQA